MVILILHYIILHILSSHALYIESPLYPVMKLIIIL